MIDVNGMVAQFGSAPVRDEGLLSEPAWSLIGCALYRGFWYRFNLHSAIMVHQTE